MRHALVLAGGSGTRLWPYSTVTTPKQLAPMLGGRSLLALAVERAVAAVGPDRVWLCAGEGLAAAVGRVGGLRPDRVVVEPEGRDTLPAVALGCATIAAHDPDAVVAVLTADHVIEPVDVLAATVRAGFEVVESRDDVLLTFGVVPDRPSTGFGYLELGPALTGLARVVTTFREKPPLADAQAFVRAGPQRFLWNSGMFVWRASTLLSAAARFAPEHARVVADVVAGTAAPGAWSALPRLSVDHGVMEPAGASDLVVAALPLSARWLDVGTWPSYGDATGRDGDGNAVGAQGALVVDSRDCVVASSDPDHVVALLGCEGLVVVHTAGATLVVPASRAQDVKALQAEVARLRPDLA